MSEWVVLGFVATTLYLVECLAWIEAGAVVCFRVPFKSRWSCADGTALPGNERGGLVVTDPAELSGSLIICHRWPISISPEGVTNVPLDGGAPRTLRSHYISFTELKEVRAEFGEVYLNGVQFARLSSSVLAGLIAQQIQHISESPCGERESKIREAVALTLDEHAATVDWAAFQGRTKTLHACCASLSALFAFSPAVLFLIGPDASWRYLLGALIFLTVITAITYFRTHAALYSQYRYDRWIHAISMILLPVAAIRGVDKLSRDALCQYGCAVIAPIMCHRADAIRVVRQHLIDLRCELESKDPSTEAGLAVDCSRWFHQVVASETKIALERLNLPVFDPPVPESEVMASYCPRCHAQYVGDADSCSSCAGIRLVTFNTHLIPARQRRG